MPLSAAAAERHLHIGGDQSDALIVDRDLELMRVARCVGELHVDAIFTVQWQVRVDHGATAGAERRALGLEFLVELIRHPIGVDKRRKRSVTDGNTAQLLSGRQILLELCRRYEKQIGDVVESAAGIVGRQQQIEIDIF